MTHEEEFVLKVKFQDTYKAIANYIRNGLGITREDVEKYLHDFAKDIVAGYDFYPAIQSVIDAKMIQVFRERYSYYPDKGLKGYIEKAIRDEVSNQVKAVVQDVVKDTVKAILKDQ